MPFVCHSQNEDYTIGLWKIEEPESFFVHQNIFNQENQIPPIKHTETRIQWMASRLLLSELIGAENYRNVKKDQHGRPYLEERGLCLSISHSEKMAAVIISKKNVGIDIQKMTDRLNTIDFKFIREDDLQKIWESNAYQLEQKHIHWGVKESLFKAYGLGGLDFKENLILNWNSQYKTTGDSFNACIKKLNFVNHYQAYYQEIDNYILCYVYES